MKLKVYTPLPKGYFIAGLISLLLSELSDLPSVRKKIVWKLLTEIKDLNRSVDKVPNK